MIDKVTLKRVYRAFSEYIIEVIVSKGVYFVFRKEVNETVVREIKKDLKGERLYFIALNDLMSDKDLFNSLVIEGKLVINELGIKVFSLFNYDLSKLKGSNKVRFVYVIKGRNGKGLVENLGGKFLTNGCFMIPKMNEGEILEVFEKWGVKFDKKEVMLTS